MGKTYAFWGPKMLKFKKLRAFQGSFLQTKVRIYNFVHYIFIASFLFEIENACNKKVETGCVNSTLHTINDIWFFWNGGSNIYEWHNWPYFFWFYEKFINQNWIRRFMCIRSKNVRNEMLNVITVRPLRLWSFIR